MINGLRGTTLHRNGEKQSDENGNDRLIWMFLVRPIQGNDVVKHTLFEDLADYILRGQNVDVEYAKMLEIKPKKRTFTSNNSLNGKKSLNYQLCMEKQLIEFT